MTPSISIVTPSFNQRPFVEHCLESVSTQSLSPCEHIILDPGSNDGSREVLTSYASRHPFAQLVFEADDGQADAINKGLRASTGDILAWLNTDDFYPTSDVLDAVERVFHEHPDIDIAYGRGLFVDIEGRKIRDAFIHTDP